MLEAMAVGRSVVTTAVAGSEIIGLAHGGAVVPIEDPAALAAAIVARLSGSVDAAAEGENGARFVSHHHDRDQCFQRLAAVLVRAHAFGRVRRRT